MFNGMNFYLMWLRAAPNVVQTYQINPKAIVSIFELILIDARCSAIPI